MTSIDGALLFWAITIGYLMTSALLFLLIYRVDKQRNQTHKEIADVQRQASGVQRSVLYLEGMARVARGEVEAMEEDADLFVER